MFVLVSYASSKSYLYKPQETISILAGVIHIAVAESKPRCNAAK